MLEVGTLMAEAADRAGSQDWGDRHFEANLARLVESCRRTANLSPLGWKVLRQVALRHLRNRLYLRQHLRAHPHLMPGSPDVAVVITGLPRTGTTLLQNLLALDPENRVLRVWEALHPIPPRPDDGDERASLVAQAESWLGGLYSLAPEFQAIHPLTATGPQECDVLLQSSFASQHFDDMFDAAEYSAWLYGADLSTEYADYAVQLEVLASADQPSRPWALKSPSHLGHLPELTKALPGALVVQCHRHPREAVASYASLVRAVRRPYAEVSEPVLGRQCLERGRTAVDRALLAWQSGHGDFLHVGYPALVNRPGAVVGQIYERLGRRVNRRFQSAMVAWLEANAQHKHGAHRYGLEEFGLTPETVDRSFGAYLDRFAPLLVADGAKPRSTS